MTKKSIQLRTVFMGTSPFAKDIFMSLLDAKYNIIGIYTQSDKKVGRKQKEQMSPVKELAMPNKIPVFQPRKFDTEAIAEIKNLKPDLIIVAAYGKILPKEVLDLPGFGCINVHVSLLPKFRGPSPIQNTILAGEKETGVTIMLMDEGIDTGKILLQKKMAIDNDDTTETVLKKMGEFGSEALLETIPKWIERKIEPVAQDESKATLCQLIEREDGHIMWDDEAQNIYNRFRALSPWPGIFSYFNNNESLQRLKLSKISLQKHAPKIEHKTGEVFEAGDKIGVQTLKGVIILEEVQLEGKNNTSIRDFINGYPNIIGSVLK